MANRENEGLLNKQAIDKNVIAYVVVAISEFAKAHHLSVREANNYLRRFKGIDFRLNHFPVIFVILSGLPTLSDKFIIDVKTVSRVYFRNFNGIPRLFCCKIQMNHVRSTSMCPAIGIVV